MLGRRWAREPHGGEMRGRDDAFIATLTPASLAFVTKAPARASSGWNIQIGARYFYSANRFQKDLGSTTDSAQASTLNSRLTYDTTGNSGEFFGRIEAPQNIFVKGNVGAGG
jgi:hypothetical protein